MGCVVSKKMISFDLLCETRMFCRFVYCWFLRSHSKKTAVFRKMGAGWREKDFGMSGIYKAVSR